MMTTGFCSVPMRRSSGLKSLTQEKRETLPPPSQKSQDPSEGELGADLEVASLAGDAQTLVGLETGPCAANESEAAAPHRILAIDEVEHVQRLHIDGQFLTGIPRHLERLRDID